MNRATPVIAAIIVTALAASCSSSSRPATPTASTASVSAPQLSENSFCSDYLGAPPAERNQFLAAEAAAHPSAQMSPMTVPPSPGGTPTVISAQQNEAVFLAVVLDNGCRQNTSARLGDVLAPAFTPSSTPPTPAATPSNTPSTAPSPSVPLPSLSISAATTPTGVPSTTNAGLCSIRSNAGNCYHAGEFCRKSDIGLSTTDDEGRTITCVEDSPGAQPHWRY